MRQIPIATSHHPKTGRTNSGGKKYIVWARREVVVFAPNGLRRPYQIKMNPNERRWALWPYLLNARNIF